MGAAFESVALHQSVDPLFIGRLVAFNGKQLNIPTIKIE
jgi:hypothetical protein